MRLPRNPFRSLKVESQESHDLFLKLFQPLAIGALGDNPWDSVQLIRSAQGGGKTSLLRVFTPECLRRVSTAATTGYIGEIAEALKGVGALSDSGPTTLGLYIPLSSTPYATIARTKLGNQDPLHLFYALLDARTILTALRGALTLNGADGDQLERLSFDWSTSDSNPLSEFTSARELYDKARNDEREIWRAIDRGNVQSVAHLGHARPYALEALSQHSLLMDEMKLCERVVVMIDDAHKLASNQRKSLLEHIITARLNVTVWVAERMHAMERYELLALDTSSSARECRRVVLSMWWQRAAESSVYRFYKDLADKRMQEVGIETPFEQVAVSHSASIQTGGDYSKSIENIKNDLVLLKARDSRFSAVEPVKRPLQSDRDYLIDLKAVQLYVEGIRSKAQQTFDLDGIVPNPQSADLSGLRATAEYQICTQDSLPLYYGANELCKAASWNVDQFLSIAGGIFDQLDAQRVRNSGEAVAPKTQESILRGIARDYWSGLPTRMAGGAKMQLFLQAFAKYALSESLGPTAKYPPGVTGIGITSRDHDRLRTCAGRDEHLRDLADLLSSAVAHNVIFMKADSKQGKKGDTVTVFYLNRLLCIYFGLPLGLGGWWKRKVDHFALLLKDERMPRSKDERMPRPEDSTANLFGAEEAQT
jgi:hypothetical protein